MDTVVSSPPPSSPHPSMSDAANKQKLHRKDMLPLSMGVEDEMFIDKRRFDVPPAAVQEMLRRQRDE